VPASVILPAGQTFATFHLTVLDNEALDGTELVQILAAATNFQNGLANVDVSDDETPLLATKPFPPHLSLNNPEDVDLSWSAGLGEGLELITNGGFEIGTFAGWNTSNTASNESTAFTVFSESDELNSSSLRVPFGGDYALSILGSMSGTRVFWRDVTVPNAQIISFAWADQWENLAGSFSSNNHFRVEVRSTNDAVLKTVFSNISGHTSFTGWTFREFNISEYRGQTIRLAFVLQTTAFPFEIFLDDISLRAANPPLTSFDVYFGTNSNLTGGELLGTTTNTFWPLPKLDVMTTYFWKIVSKRSGEIAGPIWQFRVVPSVTVSNITATEGTQSGTATFNLTLSKAISETARVHYTTLSGTALAGQDFAASSGEVEFAPGETNASVAITLTDDGAFERSETFYLSITNVENVALPAAPAQCTILNDDPLLASISPIAVDENAQLNFQIQLTASPEVLGTNSLVFSLTNAPAGAAIHPVTGMLSWTPTEGQGPGVFNLGVHVEDGIEINETESFTVTVNEVNSAPTIDPIANKVVAELSTLSFSITASDADLPANDLQFSLDAAPLGASIHPVSGVFTWSPSEGQGPSTNLVTVRVTDYGEPSLSSVSSFVIVVSEVNSAPVLLPIGNKYVHANSSLHFSAAATDADIPANSLTFSLLGTPPAGATIHPSSGNFNWSNIVAPVGSTNTITIRVQDNGSPNLAKSETFAVIVVPSPVIQNVTMQGSELTLTWSAISGRSYRVQYTSDLQGSEWIDFADVTAESGNASITEFLSGEQQKFYRVLVLP